MVAHPTGMYDLHDEINTAESTDEGYAYIRAVSRLNRAMGEDGMGLNQIETSPTTPPEDPNAWRTGSRSRKMTVFLDGTTDIRETTISCLPPDDRRRQEKKYLVEASNDRTRAVKDRRKKKEEALEKKRKDNAEIVAGYSTQASGLAGVSSTRSGLDR